MATLLLADDSLTTQKVVNLTFADEGIEVITAEDGDTALQLFHERRPDIVLADVNMPGLNGYEVCEEIRKTNDLQKTPVVLLVGSFEPFDAEAAHRVGANDYLTKPFSSIRRLVATVLAFLEEGPSTAEPATSGNEVEEIAVEPAFSEPETAEFEQTSFEQVSEVPETDAAESETSEPISTEPDSPVSKTPEPDMHSIRDIEDLYTQSFAETVEMPHAVAERTQFNDGSADDELIEATYSEPQQEAESQQEQLQAPEEDPPEPEETLSTVEQPVEEREPVAFEAPARVDEEPAEVSQDLGDTAEINVEAEPETVYFEPPVRQTDLPTEELPEELREESRESGIPNDGEAVQEISAQDAPTEEYNFEYRTEETYFEPAAESAGNPVEVAEQSQTLSPNDVPEERFTEPAAHFEQQQAEPMPDATEAQTEELPQTPTPTPWDSVAPTSREFSFDESNLLELPVDSKSYAENNSNRDTAAKHSEGALSAEIVERITRIVASQMSEQLIREIAERVVPMVVEETMARRDREEVNH